MKHKRRREERQDSRIKVMNILVVGDIFIRPEALEEACQALAEFRPRVRSLSWGDTDTLKQQEINLLVERQGPTAVPVPQNVLAHLAETEVLLVHRCPVSDALLSAAPCLKIVGVCRGGHENMDVAAATRRGVRAFHLLGRNAQAVSDFTVGLMLCEARNIARSHHDLLQGRWVKAYSNAAHVPELKGKTVGLIGFGQIARLVAHKLSGFQVLRVAHDPFVPEAEMRAAGVEPVPLDDLFRRSDFVSLHARLEKGTEKLIGARHFALMKSTAYFINTARAGLVDESALLGALRSRCIAGVALDVFWSEPLPAGSPWLNLDNVTLAAHLAGTTRDAIAHSPRLLADQIAEYLRGGHPPGLLNPL